jgi:hypothetical protein
MQAQEFEALTVSQKINTNVNDQRNSGTGTAGKLDLELIITTG